LSGLVGIGCEIGELVYVDFEYNPAITKNYNDDGVAIKDRYMGLTVGIHIETLMNKGE